MRGTLRIIAEDGTITATQYLDRRVPIDDLQKAVRGFVELVPHFATIAFDDDAEPEPCLVFCNEDGKRPDLQMRRNDRATALWYECVGRVHNDFLVGPIAVLTGDGAFLDV